jgi:hypothetical protein
VTFDGTAAAFTVDSPTQITATVPATTAGPIQVTTPGGTANGATNFTVTIPAGGGGGGGAPLPAGLTSFSPTSGPVGTSVVITGTNLTGATSVTFDDVAATFTVDSASSITASVPAGASTGKIAVAIPGVGTLASSADFTVTPTKHGRSVTLSLTKRLIASGAVSVGDEFNACRSDVTVRIQRLTAGVWTTVAKDQTTPNGRYRARLSDRAGRYRVVANEGSVNGGADICEKEVSATVSHHG